MSRYFPSTEQLKGQARRLASYLGAKHRFSLKHAAALEALACAYGAADWNTLCAQTQAASADAVEQAAQAAKPSLDQFPLAAPCGQAYTVEGRDFFRHVLVAGAEAHDRALWALAQAETQANQGLPGVVVNALGTLRTAGLRPEPLQEARNLAALDFGNAKADARYNVLQGLDRVEAASLVVKSARTAGAALSDKGLAVIYGLLTTLLSEAKSRQESMTWPALLTKIRRLQKHLEGEQGVSWEQGELTQEWIRRVHASPEGVTADAVAQWLAEVADAMAYCLHWDGLGQVLSSDPKAPGLVSLFDSSEIQFVELSDRTEKQARALQIWWLMACTRVFAMNRLDAPFQGRPASTLSLVELAEELQGSVVHRLFEQGRKARLNLSITADNEEDFVRRTEEVGTSIGHNVWNRLNLGGLPKQQAESLVETLQEASSVLCAPGHVAYRS